MADIEDILVHAWNKDAVNLKPALNDIMAAKVAERMDGIVADVASSIFGNSNGDDLDSSLNNEAPQDDTNFDYTDEEPDNEGTTKNANESEADDQD